MFGLNIANLTKNKNMINYEMDTFMGQNFIWNPFMMTKQHYIGNNLISIRLLTHVKGGEKSKLCTSKSKTCGSIKLNEINTHNLIWIFGSNNGILDVVYQIFILKINLDDKILAI